MKKILLFTILSITLSWFSFWWFCERTASSEADKPEICYSSPDWLENYLESAVYIINRIDVTQKAQWPIWLWQQAWQTPVWAAWISVTFALYWLWNFFQNFFVVFEDKHIIRDWIKLIDFKQYITKYFVRASWNGILNKNIDNQSEIQNKIEQSKFFILKWQVKTYTDVLKYVWANQLLIEKIYFEEVVGWWIWDITNNNTNSTIEDIAQKLNISSNYTIDNNKLQDLISQIRNDYYKEWEKIECSWTWRNFLKAIHNIICNIWATKVQEATERFKCNYERLKYALNLWWSNWNCWHVPIKDWIPLKDRIKFKWLWKIKDKIEELWKILSQSIPTEVNDWISDLYQTENRSYTEIPTNSIDKEKIKKAKLRGNLNRVWNTIIEDNNEVNSAITNVEPGSFTHNTTSTFTNISHQIYNARKNIWINNDKDTIFDNTATACENQSPFGWKCRPTWADDNTY